MRIEGVETTRITITRTITHADGDASDVVTYEVDPPETTLVEAYGLLMFGLDSARAVAAGEAEEDEDEDEGA